MLKFERYWCYKYLTKNKTEKINIYNDTNIWTHKYIVDKLVFCIHEKKNFNLHCVA